MQPASGEVKKQPSTIRSAEEEEGDTAAAPAIIDHVQPAADRIRTALAHKHLQPAPPPLESH